MVNHYELTPEQHAEKLKQARARYGKEFVSEINVKRVTPASYLLNIITSKSMRENKVRKLK